ncbi:alpha/beta hydrolase-fold protein [Lutimonas halocynthiae]|uniref:alpha/beta hydrolase-fold protein n=1 Tax=Lutimonas halocynthiae TaxID=1446477 RepID=UPI0025B56B91|nr:alpha/beta hydrolase-fold protein [Lutimonas halocynthiae]MDN3644009.1 alpha/beta hydrolase-fold protein [Lutimonas halocynthiae]
MKLLIIVLACCFLSINSFAQEEDSEITIGFNHTIKSLILNQDRTIKIYLPNDYDVSEQSYPVLYVLDGQEYFMLGIAYKEMLAFRDKTPKFIVVGINTDRQKRRVLFYEESDSFLGFLETELVPYIDATYRTKKEKERIYFGWEMAAGLGFEVLTEKNNLFSAFILASPTHATDERMEKVKLLKSDAIESNKFLLVTAAPEEHWITQDSTFLSIIEQPIKTEQVWRYTVLDREDHYTTPLKTIHEGLSDYFNDYKPIRLRSLKAYDQYGGLDALRAYYKKRGERYDLPTDIHKETKHFLVYNAMNEDNYERFDSYMEEFDDFLELVSRDFWLDRFASYYLKNDNAEEALLIYDKGISRFPNSAVLYEGKGDVYLAISERKKAKKAYEKSLELDEDQPEIKAKIASF